MAYQVEFRWPGDGIVSCPKDWHSEGGYWDTRDAAKLYAISVQRDCKFIYVEYRITEAMQHES